MAAKLVLALAMGATALLAPTNKLPVNTVRRAASTAPEMVVKVGVIGAGRIGLVHLEALRVAVSFLSLDAVGGSRADGVMVLPAATPSSRYISCCAVEPIYVESERINAGHVTTRRSQTQDAECVIISNPTVSKAEAAAKQYFVPEWSADSDDVINHPDVQAVWICSPSSFHAEQITKCAAAGKDVFCEKPIATDLPETIEAIRICDKAGIKLMTALQRRFDPNFARVKRSIVSGEVGDVITVKLCSRDPAPPPFEYVKGGGGIFKDMAVHDLDMSRYLVGSEPVEILASGSCHIDKRILELDGPEAYDTANIMVRYANGKEAIIDVCRQAPYGYDQRAEVLGTKAMIQTDNMYPNTARLYAADFTGNADLPYDFFMSRYKEAYKQETLAFVDALVNDKPSPCSGEDGLVALIMAITAGKSAAEQRWVKCSEVAASVQCDENGCMIVDLDDMAIAAAEKDSLNWIGKNVNRVLGKKGGLKNIFSR